MHTLRWWIASFGVALAANAQPARVERFEVLSRTDAFAGREFGAVGAYEKIEAVAHVTLDPAHVANAAVVDLALAPRNAAGRVAYDTDVIVLRPKRAGAASRSLLFEVVNRGNRLALATLNDAPRGASLANAAGAGNGFAMERGLTLAWVGWQADLSGAGLVSARLPVARGEDGPLTGVVHLEHVFDHAATPASIPLPYRLAARAEPQVTARPRQRDEPRPLTPSAVRIVSQRALEIDRPVDLDAGAIYEVVYTAQDPVVTGLGFAAVRDVVSFLRFEHADASGTANPLAGQIDRAIALGFSQSGRFLRDFLWQGFHADAEGRALFDGFLPAIAGARKTFTNFRWGQPGRFSRAHEEQRVPGNQFPFTYAVTTDSVTGARDGILARCEATKTCPKLMHVDTSAEFWQAGASLVGTDGAGHDVAFPENVRAYLLAGASHAPGMVAPYCELPANPVSYAPVMRALVVALERWVRGEAEPPASVWPRIERGELVAAAAGVPQPNTVPRVDYARVPPRIVGEGWRVLVPATDALGNDAPGVPLHALEPLPNLYLGWNPRRAGFAQGELCFLFGGTKSVPSSQRGEPRAKTPIAVAAELAQAGFLLEADREAIARAALPLIR